MCIWKTMHQFILAMFPLVSRFVPNAFSSSSWPRRLLVSICRNWIVWDRLRHCAMRIAVSQLALDWFLLPVILLGHLIAGKTACDLHICCRSSTYLVTQFSISAPGWLWTSEENPATLRLIQQCVSKLSSNRKILLEVCCKTCLLEHCLSSISNASTESATKSSQTAATLWSATMVSPHSTPTL